MGSTRFLAVELDGQALLLDVRYIKEVTGPCDSMDVPHKSGELEGVFLWNGKAIPLVSLGNFDNSEPRTLSTRRSAQRRKRTLIFHASGEWAGLAVDDATDIVDIESTQVLPARHNPGPYTTYEVDDGQIIRPIVDLAALISRVLDVSSHSHAGGGPLPSNAGSAGLFEGVE